MASAFKSPWSVIGIISIFLAIIFSSIGVILLVMFQNDNQLWAVTILIIGLVLLVAGGIFLGIGLSSKTKGKNEPEPMTSAVKSPLSISGIILLVAGSTSTIIGVIALIVMITSQNTIHWWVIIILILGVIMLIVGAILLAVGLSSKKKGIFEPESSPPGYSSFTYGSKPIEGFNPYVQTQPATTATTQPYSTSSYGQQFPWGAQGYQQAGSAYNYYAQLPQGTDSKNLYYPYTGQQASAQKGFIPPDFQVSSNRPELYNSTKNPNLWYNPNDGKYYDTSNPNRGWYYSTTSSLKPEQNHPLFGLLVS